MSLEKDKDDRRGADRFPIEREVRYKILSRKTSADGESGAGMTVNMSSNGVLFTTDRYLLPGRRLEVSISWPAQLNSKVALKLVARGRVKSLAVLANDRCLALRQSDGLKLWRRPRRALTGIA